MPLPAAARLVEFSLLANAEHPRRSPYVRPVAAPVDDEADRLAAAFLRGREEGIEAARADFMAKLASAETAYEEKLATQRDLWVHNQGTALGGKIDLAFLALTAELGDAVAAILQPFVGETLRDRIVEELRQTLAKVLQGTEPRTLKVSGPADLLDAIRPALGGCAGAIDFEANEDIDVRVTADNTIIETQLRAWLQRVIGRDE